MAHFTTLTNETPALVATLVQSLRLTFGALAEMYEHRDGPWVDELRESIATLPEREHVEALFDEFRRDLHASNSGFVAIPDH